MTIKETALSKDGYIINQSNTDNIPYGNNISNYNRCGWLTMLQDDEVKCGACTAFVV